MSPNLLARCVNLLHFCRFCVRAPALEKKVGVRLFFCNQRTTDETWNTHFVEHAQNARFFKKFGTFGKIFQGIQRFSKMQDLVEKVVFLKDPISQLFERNLNIVPRNECFVFVVPPHFGILNHRRTHGPRLFFSVQAPLLQTPLCCTVATQ